MSTVIREITPSVAREVLQVFRDAGVIVSNPFPLITGPEERFVAVEAVEKLAGKLPQAIGLQSFRNAGVMERFDDADLPHEMIDVSKLEAIQQELAIGANK